MTSIAIGADEAGAPLKEHLARYMRDAGYEVKDYGNGTEQDYPDVAAEVAEAVAAGEHDRALLVCGTGLGHGDHGEQDPRRPRRDRARPVLGRARAQVQRRAGPHDGRARDRAAGGREGARPLAGLGVRGRRVGAEGREDEGGRRALPRRARGGSG